MTTASPVRRIGFIGVGVMGEPMCRNLARKTGLPVLALDLDDAPLQRLTADGVGVATSVAELGAGSDLIFLSLPSGESVDALCRAPDGLLASARAGQVVVDLSTSPTPTNPCKTSR